HFSIAQTSVVDLPRWARLLQLYRHEFQLSHQGALYIRIDDSPNANLSPYNRNKTTISHGYFPDYFTSVGGWFSKYV
ncbi:MAG: hypothetical protein ACYS6W_15065, partial [Planctomycetota bacterium]